MGSLAEVVSLPVPEEQQEAADVGDDEPPYNSLAAASTNLSSPSRRALLGRQTLEVRTRCGDAARRDLCGGSGNPSPYGDRVMRWNEKHDMMPR